MEPPKETLVRIEEDQVIKKRVFATTLPEPRWTGSFQPPAKAEVSGVFGSARVFNGVKKSQHTGLDFRVTTGTPVSATNNGMVILAQNLYFEGNCVIIDHGQGLLTLYLHLSEFKVKEGDAVEKGQIIGLSGGTGRATAPHLHFAVRWRGDLWITHIAGACTSLPTLPISIFPPPLETAIIQEIRSSWMEPAPGLASTLPVSPFAETVPPSVSSRTSEVCAGT